ncbi:MAG: hypothetical protein ACJAZB_000238 [Psychrosphaera sp.]|jgi:hypothetical protein
MSHFINLDLNRLMQAQSDEINQLKKSPTYIVDGYMSYMLNRKSNTVSLLEKAIEKSNSYIFNVLNGDLGTMTWRTHMDNLNQLAHKQRKLAFVHAQASTHTLKSDQLLERLNSKFCIGQCNNQDLEVAATTAERVQHVQLNQYSQTVFDTLFTKSTSIVGLFIAKDEFELDEYTEIKNKFWSDYTPFMVSIGYAIDTSIDQPWELHLFNFSGQYSSFPNVVEVEDDYIFLTDDNAELFTCAASKYKGENQCLFKEEKLTKTQTYSSAKDGKHYCGSCIERYN